MAVTGVAEMPTSLIMATLRSGHQEWYLGKAVSTNYSHQLLFFELWLQRGGRGKPPSLQDLYGSITAWPEPLRSQAEDMLFEKNCEERVVSEPFTTAVIKHSRERWQSSGQLDQMIARVEGVLKKMTAPETWPELNVQLMHMMSDAGRARDGIEMLYNRFCRSEQKTDYSLAVFLIAVASQLNSANVEVRVPDYPTALAMAELIFALAQCDAAFQGLTEIYQDIQRGEFDPLVVQQHYNAMFSELMTFNDGGSMLAVSTFYW